MSHVHPTITEADLHAYVDGQLDPARLPELEAYLATRPDEVLRVSQYRAQKRGLRALYAPVLEETLPPRLVRAALPRQAWYAQRLVAGLAIAVVSAAAAWFVRGNVDGHADGYAPHLAQVSPPAQNTLSGFALRAAVAHVIYSPEVRHPVEVNADQEQHLVAWLSKRLGAAVKVPSLQPIGYELIGGRLLPGDNSPVAQFMYHDAAGQRLTLYVTHEAPKPSGQPETAFRFGQDGAVNVFYWVDKNFGYALSGSIDKQELTRVAHEVYRQIAPG
ncbi:anti-sigma factor family protein [Rhodoferax sp.]|uniref:anti-sigma factor family protein n=1 Tax=Rhodoferax sp. TaxID=50421 RepID=UPI00374CFC6D